MEKLQQLFLKDKTLTNPGAIDLYRIIFGISGLIFSINTLDQFYLLFAVKNNQEILFFHSLIFLWIAFSIHLILFNPSRFWLVFQFFVLAILMSNQQGVFNVEGKFIVFGTFFNLFLPLNGKKETDLFDKGFIVIMLVVMTAYLFYGGFITKSMDVNWASGSGLYFVMILPWIKYPVLDILLNSKYLLMAMNYYVLIVELFAFPFSIFNRTRPVGIFLAWCFCLFLFCFLQISTIGLSALAFAALFLSIFPFKVSFLQKRGWSLNSQSFRSFFLLKPLVKLNDGVDFMMVRFKKLSIIGLTVFVGLVIIRDTDAAYLKLGSNSKWRHLDRLNRMTLCLFYDHLFTAMHFQDVEEYKVKIKLKSGEMIEPVVIFNEDKTGGSWSGFPQNARWLQAEMYRLNESIVCPYIETFEVLPYQVQKLFRYMQTKVKDYRDIESFHLITSPLLMPEAYDPKGCQYSASSPWKEILVYYPETKLAKLPTSGKELILTKQ